MHPTGFVVFEFRLGVRQLVHAGRCLFLFLQSWGRALVVLVVSSSDTIHSSLDFVLGHTNCRIRAMPKPHRTVRMMHSRTPTLVLVSVGFALSAAKRRKLALLERIGVFHPSIPIVLVAT